MDEDEEESTDATANGFARVYGALRGRIAIAEDADDLPNDLAEAFGAR